MTDLTSMAGQFLVQPGSNASTPQLNPTQRFEALLNMPSGADVYVDKAQTQAASSNDAMRPVQMPQEVFAFGNDLSSQMRAALEKPSLTQTIDTERFPELAVAQAISADTRQFMLLDMQIHFVSKSAEVSEKSLQTLYKQQG
jgi:hypothetical protein